MLTENRSKTDLKGGIQPCSKHWNIIWTLPDWLKRPCLVHCASTDSSTRNSLFLERHSAAWCLTSRSTAPIGAFRQMTVIRPPIMKKQILRLQSWQIFHLLYSFGAKLSEMTGIFNSFPITLRKSSKDFKRILSASWPNTIVYLLQKKK